MSRRGAKLRGGWLKQRANSQVTVFDESADPVALARQQAADAGIYNVTLVCSRAQESEYERGTASVSRIRTLIVST
jgi:hypothetical protein